MKGKVYLVGAGPGDYKLLTLKGLECIKKADVIVYDRLANKNYLKEAKENCEFIYVGKASSNHTLPQDDINRVIADKAKEGKIVTRLKGGDPYVFGRGEIPADTCKVKVNYKGTLIDGTEFDSSYKRNEPATFRANQVIKGWTEALTMMPVGSKWELYIPQELAYGSRESGQIKPFSTLIFEVELVGIEKDKK